MTLLHEAPDAFHRVLASNVSGGPSVTNIPQR